MLHRPGPVGYALYIFSITLLPRRGRYWDNDCFYMGLDCVFNMNHKKSLEPAGGRPLEALHNPQ